MQELYLGCIIILVTVQRGAGAGLSGLLISYQTQTKSQVCKIGYNLLGCHHHSHGRLGSRAEHTEHRSDINFVSSGSCDPSLFSVVSV